jgi:hypothetical protein
MTYLKQSRNKLKQRGRPFAAGLKTVPCFTGYKMEDKRPYEEDDGRVIADMSGIEKQPLFFPSADSIKRVKENRSDFAEPPVKSVSSGPENLDNEGRRAMIAGALSAMLLIGGLLAAAFAAIILIIGHLH